VTIFVAVLNSADVIERVSLVVGGLFDWGLAGDVYDSGDCAVVQIKGAQVSDVYREPEKEVEVA